MTRTEYLTKGNINDMGTWAYTANDQLWVPDIRLMPEDVPAGGATLGLRGYRHTRAVIDAAGRCIGYLVVDWQGV